MPVKQGKEYQYYNDLVDVGILCGRLGLFDREKLDRYIQRFDIETHVINDGMTTCIRRNDYYRITNHILRDAYQGKDTIEPVVRKYEGELLKKSVVAKILGVSTRTVDRLIANGNIEATKLGDSEG